MIDRRGLPLRVWAAVAIAAVSPQPAAALHRARIDRQSEKPPVVLPPPSSAPTPSPAPDSRPYDAQLMRLASILGTLTYMRDLCGYADGDAWRQRMQALLQSEGDPPVRKERLAGAYNRAYRDYGLSYRSCTSNARLVIERYLAEGERLAKDVENRYRAS